MKYETKIDLQFIGYDTARKGLGGIGIAFGTLEAASGFATEFFPAVAIGALTIFTAGYYIKAMCPECGPVGKPFMVEITDEYDRIHKYGKYRETEA